MNTIQFTRNAVVLNLEAFAPTWVSFNASKHNTALGAFINNAMLQLEHPSYGYNVCRLLYGIEDNKEPLIVFKTRYDESVISETDLRKIILSEIAMLTQQSKINNIAYMRAEISRIENWPNHLKDVVWEDMEI